MIERLTKFESILPKFDTRISHIKRPRHFKKLIFLVSGVSLDFRVFGHNILDSTLSSCAIFHAARGQRADIGHLVQRENMPRGFPRRFYPEQISTLHVVDHERRPLVERFASNFP